MERRNWGKSNRKNGHRATISGTRAKLENIRTGYKQDWERTTSRTPAKLENMSYGHTSRTGGKEARNYGTGRGEGRWDREWRDGKMTGENWAGNLIRERKERRGT